MLKPQIKLKFFVNKNKYYPKVHQTTNTTEERAVDSVSAYKKRTYNIIRSEGITCGLTTLVEFNDNDCIVY